MLVLLSTHSKAAEPFRFIKEISNVRVYEAADR